VVRKELVKGKRWLMDGFVKRKREKLKGRTKRREWGDSRGVIIVRFFPIVRASGVVEVKSEEI
jgi:hypothetical protein